MKNKKRKIRMVSIRIAEDLYQRSLTTARSEGVSLSEFIRRTLEHTTSSEPDTPGKIFTDLRQRIEEIQRDMANLETQLAAAGSVYLPQPYQS